MSNSKRLDLSILDHLTQLQNAISGEKAETLEVAIQCLEQVFNVESYDDNQKESLKVDKTLQEIFDTYVKEHIPEEKSEKHTVLEPTAKDRERAEELKGEGNQLMKGEKYQEAINCYTQAIELDNTNPVYPCNRAAAYSKLNEHQKAVDDCQRALKLDPNYSKAYGRMGLSYQKMNDLPQAQDSYKRAIELEPNNDFYKNNLKVIEEAMGQRQGAQPNLGQGMPNMGNMDFASLLSNPAVMNMAQSFMSSPHMQQMVSSMMTGGAMSGMGGMGATGPDGATGGGPGAVPGAVPGAAPGPGGPAGMSHLFQAAQRFGEQLQETNPELMHDLRAQAQETFHRTPDNNPFSGDYNQPPEKKDDDPKE